MTLTQDDFHLLQSAAEAGLLTSLHGRRFAITGTLSMKRDDIQKLIRACSGTPDDSPTYGTDYLIVGDTHHHGNTRKMHLALERGARIISESEFIAMIRPQ